MGIFCYDEADMVAFILLWILAFFLGMMAGGCNEGRNPTKKHKHRQCHHQ